MGSSNSLRIRQKFPRFYKYYQEIFGDLFYEVICLGPIVRSICHNRLRNLEKSNTDPYQTAKAFKGIQPYKDIKPVQFDKEFYELIDILKEHKPKTVLEIGTDAGGTLYVWSKIMADDGLLISMDLPRLYRKSLNRFFRSFCPKRGKMAFIRGDSHTAWCEDKIRDILDGQMIDYLFIDGDHSYEGSRQDFLMYSKYVRPGGLITFHDIAPDTVELEANNVLDLWLEVKDKYKSWELLSHENQAGAGIGVIKWDPDIESE